MKAYGKRVLVKPIPEKEPEPGSIIIPDSAKEKQETATGKVVSAGEEVESYLEAGDTILFFAKAGVSVSINGEKHLLVSPENILAIL